MCIAYTGWLGKRVKHTQAATLLHVKKLVTVVWTDAHSIQLGKESGEKRINNTICVQPCVIQKNLHPHFSLFLTIFQRNNFIFTFSIVCNHSVVFYFSLNKKSNKILIFFPGDCCVWRVLFRGRGGWELHSEQEWKGRIKKRNERCTRIFRETVGVHHFHHSRKGEKTFLYLSKNLCIFGIQGICRFRMGGAPF